MKKGECSPQVDIIVLSPEYPKQLLDTKEYLAAGVVAAFECKLTLDSADIRKFMANSSKIREMITNFDDPASIRNTLVSPLYYGLLAHSHNWKKSDSKPIENIRKQLIKCDNELIHHPKEMPECICVADLNSWHSNKLVIPDNLDTTGATGYLAITSYIEANSENDNYTPVGAMIYDLMEFLAWNYPNMRNLVRYMSNIPVQTGGTGKIRTWPNIIKGTSNIQMSSCCFPNWWQENGSVFL